MVRGGVVRKVGDGTDTFFWTDPWVGGIPLCERFGRLFDIAATKSPLQEYWSFHGGKSPGNCEKALGNALLPVNLPGARALGMHLIANNLPGVLPV
jgi:hypothetical protein